MFRGSTTDAYTSPLPSSRNGSSSVSPGLLASYSLCRSCPLGPAFTSSGPRPFDFPISSNLIFFQRDETPLDCSFVSNLSSSSESFSTRRYGRGISLVTCNVSAIDRSASRCEGAYAVGIGVTQMFSLDSDCRQLCGTMAWRRLAEIPLPSAEHLGKGEDERSGVGMRMADWEIPHPHEADEDVRDHGKVVHLTSAGAGPRPHGH